MKLPFSENGRTQPDPYIFEYKGKFYLYVTAGTGVEAYTADTLLGPWSFYGVVCAIDGCRNYWAPCILRYGEKFYLYFSCESAAFSEWLHVASSDSPLGPFTNAKLLYQRFTIDAHVVETRKGLFLFYAENNTEPERCGTRVFVDRLLDPETPANLCKEVIVPTFDEEIFRRNRLGDGIDWHTIEGPFWFREGQWQYLMYSGGCYTNDSYHIGYCAAKSDEEDLTAVDFIKHTDNGRFSPVLIKNDVEEGTGHHSVIRYNGEYYAIYHGRDYQALQPEGYQEARTARICRLSVENGIITAQPML